MRAVPGPSGVALSLFGAATLVRPLLVSVSRRRAEAGLLKVLPALRAARTHPADLLRAE